MRNRWNSSFLPVVFATLLLTVANGAKGEEMMQFNYPRVADEHHQMRQLLDNAFHYINPDHGLIDPESGYPVEGWNQQPQQGLFLRSFTQLTAVGSWLELLANIAAGYAENLYITPDEALAALRHAMTTLLADQQNPELAAKGLLVNFLGFAGDRRVGPLAESVEQQKFVTAFGKSQGKAIWQALLTKGWLEAQDAGRKGVVRRSDQYGANFFNGVLEPYGREPLKSQIMALLDQRVVTIIFGDNVNLTAALARASGALLRSTVKDNAAAIVLREQIEHFIERQGEGYAHLYDPKSGTFYFGWDASIDRFVGWDDGQGHWVTGQMNYAINEFRGPWSFAVLRYGLPLATLRNAGFKMRSYRLSSGRDLYAPQAWDGSAFQLLGLSQFMQEMDNPGWRQTLENLVAITLDFARRHAHPALLSEAYSGHGTEYTGHIGIPDMAVSHAALNTHAPSLYTLGVAYMVVPDAVEDHLQRYWRVIDQLFTTHGPWEGWDSEAKTVIPYQTTAHTLSLILGGINSAQENMQRYLQAQQLLAKLALIYPEGDRVNLLAAEHQIVTWSSDNSSIDFSRQPDELRFASPLTADGGVSFIFPEDQVMSFSNGRLQLRYRGATAISQAFITFKRAKNDPLPPPAFPVEIAINLSPSEAGVIEVVLPATPALTGIAEVALLLQGGAAAAAVDLTLSEFRFTPFPVNTLNE
ncbi:MAG: hypothetical protein HQL49_03385 [Gammaproteobacteria bacterium]|nr:hypothetical protein [Gammaproteobacteria bacterium]